MRSFLISLPLFLFVSILLYGCSDPDTRKLAHYDKGMEYIQKEDISAAILEFRNAIQIDDTYANAHYQLALAYLQTGNIQKGLQELQKTVFLDPSNVDAQLKTAELYLFNQNLEDSLSLIHISEPTRPY